MKSFSLSTLRRAGVTAAALLTCASLIACLPARTYAQSAATSAETPATPPVIPQQVRYAGKLAARSSESVEAVFHIYATAEGGEPLWSETQQLSVAADGSYSALLGATTPAGLPQTVFAGGAARWLGVTVERGEEQPRVLLSSVPYAMKSADAESLAGHQAAEFVTQTQLDGLTQKVNKVEQSAATPAFQPELTPSGNGTTNTVPLWTSSSTLGNSVINESGAKIGINFAAPTTTLEVGGPMTVHGTLNFPPGTSATPNSSSQSQSFQFSASAWNSTTAAPVSFTYNMLAGPAGNNTANPTSIFYFSYQNGTNPFTTMFTVNAKGVLGLPNSGGGIASNGNVSLAPAAWATASAASNSPLLEIGASSYSSSSNAARAQTFAWQAQAAGNDTTAPTGSLALLFGSNGATPAPTGLAIAPNGQITFAPNQTFPVKGTGGGTITGITTTSPLTGSGTSGSVALGFNTAALESTLDARYAQVAAPDSFTAPITVGSSAGAGNAAVTGNGTSGTNGVVGSSDTGNGVFGSSSGTGGQEAGVLGQNGSPSGTYQTTSNRSAGVWADSSQSGSTGLNFALFATADDATAIRADNQSSSYTIIAQNGSGPALYAAGGFDGADIQGDEYGVDARTYGNYSGYAGVLGHSSDSYNSKTFGDVVITSGVWGDTDLTQSETGDGSTPVGVVGTADNTYAGAFYNNSSTYATLTIHNFSSGGTGAAAPGMFTTLKATDSHGTCGIGSGGNLSCTGQVKTLVSAGAGARRVETYGIQSPENWMEDFGSGELHNGVAVVAIDPAFAETVTGDANYHVFITPRGDSKGLYVINATATTFEVRESGGGMSSLAFDYRIVARRRGFETQRLVDVTTRYNAEVKTASLERQPGAHKARVAPRKPVPPAVSASRQAAAPRSSALRPGHTQP